MKITDIKSQEKNKQRYSIYIDEKYSFSLSDWQLLKSKIKVGDEVSSEDIAKFKHKADLGKIFDRTLNWIYIRHRSEWEIDQYLKRKTKDESIIEEIKSYLVDKNHIDDEKFSKAWLENRRLLKNVSKRKIKQELLSKRVSDSVINSVLEKDEVADIDELNKLIDKKLRISRYKDKEKLMAYLSRQGFNYQDIKEAFSSRDL